MDARASGQDRINAYACEHDEDDEDRDELPPSVCHDCCLCVLALRLSDPEGSCTGGLTLEAADGRFRDFDSNLVGDLKLHARRRRDA